MTKRQCTQDGCSKLAKVRELCAWHYEKARRTGVFKRRTLEERFWAKVEKTETCWLWTGTRTPDGYGKINIQHDGRSVKVYAHRVSFEMSSGEIPQGMSIDHICRQPSCVNPEHLRATTHKQNKENLGGANRNNRCGVRGVHWSAQNKGWMAVVGHNGKRHHVGTFRNLRDAEAAVIAKRNELFTHNDTDRIAS